MKCSICGNEIENKHGWTQGNNAEPVNSGRCCDQCDCNIVIPRRLRDMGISDQKAKGVGELDMKLRKIQSDPVEGFKASDLRKAFNEALKKAGFIQNEEKAVEDHKIKAEDTPS